MGLSGPLNMIYQCLTISEEFVVFWSYERANNIVIMISFVNHMIIHTCYLQHNHRVQHRTHMELVLVKIQSESGDLLNSQFQLEREIQKLQT